MYAHAVCVFGVCVHVYCGVCVCVHFSMHKQVHVFMLCVRMCRMIIDAVTSVHGGMCACVCAHVHMHTCIYVAMYVWNCSVYMSSIQWIPAIEDLQPVVRVGAAAPQVF